MQKELGHCHKPFSNKTCTNRQPHAPLEFRGVKSRSLISKSDFLPPLFITGNQGGKKSRDRQNYSDYTIIVKTKIVVKSKPKLHQSFCILFDYIIVIGICLHGMKFIMSCTRYAWTKTLYLI